MEKIKFRNAKKYKGIVEKVFVKDGQPIKKDQVLAVISTQLERFNISSPIDGVIRNVYIIESLIISHGDTVFDVFTDLEINNLLKKPSSINNTLREGLNEFGYLEKLINQEPYDYDQDYSKKNYVLTESLTKEIENLKDLKLGLDASFEIDKENSFDQLNEDFDISFSKKEENDLKSKPEFEKENFLNPISVKDSITEELAWHTSNVFEDEKDLQIFSEDSSEIRETQIEKNIEDQQFLSKFSSFETEDVFEEMDNELKNQLEKNIEIIDQKENYDDFHNVDLSQVIEDEERIFFEEQKNNKNIDFENFINQKLDVIQNDLFIASKNSELLNNSLEKIAFLEKQISDLKLENSKINLIENDLKNSNENNKIIKDILNKVTLFENKLNELELNKDKLYFIEKEIADFTKNSQLINQFSKKIQSLESQVTDVKFKNEKFKQEIKDSSNLKVFSSQINKEDLKVSYVDFSVDITALINLQTLMIEPSKKNNIKLELNAFFVKALKKAIIKFKELKADNDLICLIENNNGKINEKYVNVYENSSILDIAKNISTLNKNANISETISLYDLTNTNINNAKLNLYKNNIITIYFSSINNLFKEDGMLASFLNLSFAFNEELIAFEEMVKFTTYFVNILKNPGFLI